MTAPRCIDSENACVQTFILVRRLCVSYGGADFLTKTSVCPAVEPEVEAGSAAELGKSPMPLRRTAAGPSRRTPPETACQPRLHLFAQAGVLHSMPDRYGRYDAPTTVFPLGSVFRLTES